jgi:hypothetical protein
MPENRDIDQAERSDAELCERDRRRERGDSPHFVPQQLGIRHERTNVFDDFSRRAVVLPP